MLEKEALGRKDWSEAEETLLMQGPYQRSKAGVSFSSDLSGESRPLGGE